MLKIATLIMALLLGTTVSAQTVTIPKGTAKADLYIEAELQPGAYLQLLANDNRFVTLNVPAEIPSDIYGQIDVILTINDSTLQTSVPSSKSAAPVNLKIKLNDGMASAILYGSAMKSPFKVPYIFSAPTVLLLKTNVTVKNFSHNLTEAPSIALAPFGSVEALKKHISASTDLNEAFWEYFDRKTDPLKASLGGKYLIATLANGNGYDIVYISGAEVNRNLWTPLSIKGSLLPDGFIGSYILHWTDADGHDISYETSATIDGNLLSLSFPYWKSTLRFVKTDIE